MAVAGTAKSVFEQFEVVVVSFGPFSPIWVAATMTLLISHRVLWKDFWLIVLAATNVPLNLNTKNWS